jgi:hypothetical protein
VQTVRCGRGRGGREAGLSWNSIQLRSLSILIAYLAIGVLPIVAIEGQQGASTPQVQRPIIILNRDPDVHDLNELAQKNARTKNFNAANEARKLQIDDETNKLLILARDLKAKTDKLGTEPLPPLLEREAAIIEFLANDVKEKMKLTISPD